MPKKGGLLKSTKEKKSCKSFDLQDSVRREVSLAEGDVPHIFVV